MTDTLLATKLRMPPVRPALVPRERLLAQLDRALTCQVCLVSAPAGFGKTTLVAAWAARRQLPAAWLSLEAGDNDPARFLAYVIAALQQGQPQLGHSTFAMLPAPRLPPLPTLLRPLINEIEGAGSNLVLILDDYHLIQAQPIHDALTFLIDHQPAPLHLVLVTRADPPLPIARLRARGQLAELRQSDLRFTPEEAGAFLRLAASRPLTAAHVAELAERTEGWAAGLQMAATSLQTTTDVDVFVRAFAGTQRHILDYLGEEILQRQPPDVQQFLLRTSVLQRLCGPLCDAVMAGDPAPRAAVHQPVPRPASAVLADLDRGNLFITPLDERREWYRYHQLFADFLRLRLRQAHPELVPVLHGCASRWHEAQGLLNEAIDHAVAAGEGDRAAALVDKAAGAEWKQGGLTTLRRWLEALPDDAVRARPRLCLYRAFAQIVSGSALSEVDEWLAAALAADAAGEHQGEIAVVGSLLALLRSDLAAGLRLAEQALAILPEHSLFHGLALRGLSGLYLLRGDFAQAAAILEADVRASQQSGDRLGAAVSLRRLGSLRLAAGQLHAARDLYRRSLDVSVDATGRRWPVAGRALYHLAEVSYEWNDLDGAEQILRECIPLAAQVAPNWNTTAYVMLALVRQARGDAAGARTAMDEAEQLASQSDTELDDVLVSAHAAHLALIQGDLALAERWAAESTRRPAPGHSGRDVEAWLTSVWVQEVEGAVLARLELAQDRPAQASALLAPLLAAAEQQGRARSVIELLALRALAEQAAGSHPAALASLTQALAQAEPEGFVRLFVDEGEPMARLLGRVTGARQAYAQRLLGALAGPDGRRPAAPQPLAEPLTERELDILRLIVEGLSNREIGAALHLAPGTIKSYTYSLYGKLAVHSRTQAIARARALGLLEPP